MQKWAPSEMKKEASVFVVRRTLLEGQLRFVVRNSVFAEGTMFVTYVQRLVAE